MKKIALVLIAVVMVYESSAQPIHTELLVSIHEGRQNEKEIKKIMVPKGLTFGIYKDTLLQLANQTSLINEDFVLFEMFFNDRQITYRVCKQSIFNSWAIELENIGFFLLGSKEVNGCMTDLYAKEDLRVGISINPKEQLLKYQFFLYNVNN